MDKAIKWKPFILTIAIILALIIQPVQAYSIHTPLWHDRPSLQTQSLDEAVASYITGSTLYVIHDVYDSQTGYNEIAVTVHSTTDGAISFSQVYSVRQGSIYAGDITMVNGNLYITGTIATTGYVGYIIELDPATLSIINQYTLDLTNNNYDAIITGICSDTTGNIYIVGRALNNTSNLFHLLVAKLDIAQSQWIWTTITASDQNGTTNYDIVGWSCTVVPGGDLYVTGHTLWHDTTSGYYYAVNLVIVDLSTQDLSIQGSTTIPLANSANYVTVVERSDITYSSGELLIAFSYTDELPAATNPSFGASIAGFDTQLNSLWRKNYTTSNHEAFTTITAASNGWVAVGGWTFNDFGTGLGTNYSHGLIVVLDNTYSPVQAFMYGASDNSSVVSDLEVDSNYYLYSVGYDYSDLLEVYDVTGEALIDINRQTPVNPPASNPASLPSQAVKIPRGYASDIVLKGEYSTSVLEESNSIQALKPDNMSVGPIRPEVTASGASSSIVIAYDYQATVPPPVPEPTMLVVIVVVLSMAFVLLRFTPSRLTS